jgi:hypothetical protein
MAPKKIRCTFKECRDAAQRIVGDCGFCNGHFCGKHRLLEDHKCDGLEDVSTPTADWWLIGLHDVLHEEGLVTARPPLLTRRRKIQCKKQSHERNAAQLEAERTQVIRGV